MIDLRQLMDERSQTVPDLTGLRLLAVRRRIKRRRQIVAGIVASVAVIALIAGLTLTPGMRSAPTPAATPSPRLIDGFHEYAGGAHVVATAHRRVADGPVTLEWTPTSRDVVLFLSCTFTAPSGTQLTISIRVDGQAILGQTCGTDGTTGSWGPLALGGLNPPVTIGRPLAVTIVATEARDRTGSGPARTIPIPSDAVVGLAIGVLMDFDAYPLPPRPSVLPSLKPSDLITDVVHDPRDRAPLRMSDAADPLRPLTQTILWGGKFDLYLPSATPGFLRVTVDGVEITDCRLWTYDGGGCPLFWGVDDPQGFPFVDTLHSKIGQTVTLTITPTHVTGPWGYSLTQVS